MKHINESIIGRKGVGNMKFPRDPKQLEHVSDWELTLRGISFNIDIPDTQQKGVRKITDFIWNIVFETHKITPNLTQWFLNYLQNDHIDLCHYNIRYNKPGRGTVGAGGIIQNKLPVFDSAGNDIWHHIYEKVSDFDKDVGLDNISLGVTYKYNPRNGQLDEINIYLN